MTSRDEDPRDAWAAFEARLAAALAAMEHATYLVVSLASEPRAGASAYVQFAQGGLLGFRAEAAGNHWLPPGHGLGPDQEERLATLGWQRPGPASLGRNWVREWQEPVPFAEVADVAVRTLREVYGATSIDELRYRSGGFPAHQGLVGEPDLGIPSDRPVPEQVAGGIVPSQPSPGVEPDQAAGALEAALAEFIGGANLVPDRDGDLPIRVGSALMFVRPVAGRPPLLQVFAPIVSGVDLTPALLESLNDINRNILFGRVFWTDREVVVSMELTAVGVTTPQIAFACVQLGNLADHLDDVLRGRFGGRTMFEVPKTLVN
jgi:T3SS (YopN, CesT) and YbjN peptide-binding chaperone 1/T3SS (YopN, CesT) and YbjN peptide-binding chaperone 3